MDLAHNIAQIRERIAQAALSVGRSPGDVSLLAVTKTFSVDVIQAAIDSGLRHFGENKVQEAESKIEHFSRSRADLHWHLVGHLQSNKARLAARLFPIIHSVDSAKLAHRLSQAAAEAQAEISVLIQVDLAEEPTKFGCPYVEVPDLAGLIGDLPALKLDGLMTLPPFFEDPEKTRPYFRRLRDLMAEQEVRAPGSMGRKELSMGMSHDYEVAISEGATIVRLGTALFGVRKP